jgi:hypothetical protein
MFMLEKGSRTDKAKFEEEWSKLNKENTLEESIDIDEVNRVYKDKKIENSHATNLPSSDLQIE